MTKRTRGRHPLKDAVHGFFILRTAQQQTAMQFVHGVREAFAPCFGSFLMKTPHCFARERSRNAPNIRIPLIMRKKACAKWLLPHVWTLAKASRPPMQAWWSLGFCSLFSSDQMYEKAAQELGFKPGRLGGHKAPGVGHGKELSDGCGIHEEGDAAGSVRAVLQFLRTADPADKIDARVRPGISDPEHGSQDIVLENGDIQTGDRVCRPVLGADGQRVSFSSQIHSHLPLL